MAAKKVRNINQYDDNEGSADTFQQQALEIRLPGANFDPKATPTTGEEYLTHMAYERSNTPTVVSRRPKKIEMVTQLLPSTSGFNDVYSPDMTAEQIREFTMNSFKMLPNDEWKAIQTHNFEKTRKEVNIIRSILKPDIDITLPDSDNWKVWLDFCQKYKPRLSIVLGLGQRNLELLLDIVYEWIHMGEQNPTQNDDGSNSSDDFAASTTNSGLASNEYDVSQLKLTKQWLGEWVYAILACLELPLEPEVHSSLRNIARVCVRQRGLLKLDDINGVMTYNIFIFLIAKVFGQLDFVEFI